MIFEIILLVIFFLNMVMKSKNMFFACSCYGTLFGNRASQAIGYFFCVERICENLELFHLAFFL